MRVSEENSLCYIDIGQKETLLITVLHKHTNNAGDINQSTQEAIFVCRILLLLLLLLLFSRLWVVGCRLFHIFLRPKKCNKCKEKND